MKRQALTLFFFILLILSAGAVYSRYSLQKNRLNPAPQNQQSNSPKFKTFKSADLDFSVRLPDEYEIEEGTKSVDFKLKENAISVVKNFDPVGNGNLEKYLEYFDNKNGVESTSEKKNILINGYRAISRKEKSGETIKKAYYIYISGTDKVVYTFTTDSETLYSDLDQIVQSFRYTPEELDTTSPANENTEIQTL